MKILSVCLLLAMGATFALADGIPQLIAIQQKYNAAELKKNEPLRERYIMDLAKLRFTLLNGPWQKVDAEIEQHPAPANSDSADFSKLRLGVWHSPRHDYRYKADGTWRMIDDEENTTHGTWSIKGNSYDEHAAADIAQPESYTIILLNAEYFIFTDGNALFIEKRTLGKGLPLRRDERGE
jgi:hypothetical protein